MSELTEDQKLVKLGLRSPNQTQSAGAELIEKFKTNIAEEWSDFQTAFDNANLTSWNDFETWLTDNGFTTNVAGNIRTQLEGKYASWSDFSDTILNEYSSWADFENDFASNSGLRSDREDSETGLAAAGVKVFEESGVGRSGQEIPAGGVEVYGAEVHFSETTAVRETKDESAGGADAIAWSNLSVSPTTADVLTTVTVEADVTNNTSYPGSTVAELLVDDTVIETKTVDIAGNTTKTVSMNWLAGKTDDGEEVGTFAVGLSKAGTQDVTVIYPNL